ncbi:MAG: dihydrodipicolinate synthase family protein [Thermoproteota archaeon]|jgi:4-hydroxy-tetrahydrodipicolinate synthase|uniref:Dihydrodipicolinate synthase family protein n=1 Tax=Candidatus Methanodesulfokora washburnensis TaxID=2478471 RepID=A0A3R9RB59_9CREN|nr:dihydrodipicolinate synthase family protein [Candidatus Methanodesulfokores washburnensis]RSN79123.1 dihydrodipicolinate synthase family protein [Candidatus Methanodesulfokores washburnensis]RZN59996.1 MAG: dihydrodipicolinate synthase family protein [Candidatus Methanodesulfokores washburnensis]TDA39106.1 MAG: dihydrodipicolinate synthase family protein [Candidatus Korarchaeota archaeon]
MQGIIVPMITPFKEDLSIDFEATEWLVERLERGEVDGIFPYSTTGEFVHLSEEEGVSLAEKVIDSSKRAMILPGISSNSTDTSIRLGRRMKEIGANGVVVTPPFFFKLREEHLILHFSTIADKVDLPIILYNIPALTGNMISVSAVMKLAEEHSNIAGIKVTYDSISYMRNLMEVKSVRRDFSILTGLDDHLFNTLAIGGDGGIVACANIAPELHVSLYRSFRKGDLNKAVEVHRRICKLVKLYDVASYFPTSIKTAMKFLGYPVKPYVRKPLSQEPEEVEREILRILKDAGLVEA